jgi:hypothetical protein
MLLAIDPGESTGWALYASGRLVACGLGDPRSHEKHRVSDIDTVVIEHPLIYAGGRTKNPNSVLKTLAVSVGRWIGTYEQRAPTAVIETVLPVQWKGSVPKDIHHAREWAALGAVEQAVVTSAFVNRPSRADNVRPSLRHNVLDAVALGVWKLGH